MQEVTVIGAGLAGCEATYQCIKRGIPVHLIEMRPKKSPPAFHTDQFAELVCSNSLRSNAMNNAVGVLKEELRKLDSLIMKAADENAVPAGSALAVDRNNFSKQITETLKNHPLVRITYEEVTTIPDGPCIIATGPLTSDALSKSIQEFIGQDDLHFYDAAAPIVELIPEATFCFAFSLFIIVYFLRGKKTLLFGPMKPVGLAKDENHHPVAVVQLRQDNVGATLYNIVGFQTHLTWPEQRKVFSLIPGLENLNITRYGVMHRNSFINSPEALLETYQSKKREDLFFAGQLTGVEGYVESCASGCIAGINMARLIQGKDPIVFGNTCIMGSQAHYITHCDAKHFQPMNANFGLVHLEQKCKKFERKEKMAAQALSRIESIKENL